MKKLKKKIMEAMTKVFMALILIVIFSCQNQQVKCFSSNSLSILIETYETQLKLLTAKNLVEENEINTLYKKMFIITDEIKYKVISLSGGLINNGDINVRLNEECIFGIGEQIISNSEIENLNILFSETVNSKDSDSIELTFLAKEIDYYFLGNEKFFSDEYLTEVSNTQFLLDILSLQINLKLFLLEECN